MAELLTLLAVLGLFAAVLVGLAWFGARLRRRGRGAVGEVMGPFEEIWHPAAQRARLTAQTAEERLAPMPPPDGPPDL